MSTYRLTQIWIYPIKSLGGIRLTSARVKAKGLEYDRRWMLVDENNHFLTQRVHHNMALFKLQMNSKYLVVRFNNEELNVPLAETSHAEKINATIWDDTVITQEVNPLFSAWFSEKLNFRCKLVSFPEENSRLVDGRYAPMETHVSLADAYPFLIIGQSSLDDLNKRLEKPVPMNRFRPNFVFEGGLPYEEDHWKNFRVGNARFVGVKLCGRCVLTTINQETGESGKEPLATLATYRAENGKINFGQNLLALTHHEIYEGDSIILEN